MIAGSLSRSCPVCGEAGSTALFTKATLRLVRCRGCGMIYADPIGEELANGEYYDRLANPFYLSPAKLAGDYSPVRFERERKLFRRFHPGGRVLDVGCSTGGFLHQLQRQLGTGAKVLGIDVSGPALDHAEGNGIPVLRQPFLTAEFTGEAFSSVTFWAVMEHLANPREFLSKAASILKPRGLCFILVPNFQSLAVRLLGSKYRYIFPQHINYFTPATLRGLVATEPRFRIVHLGSTHFNPLVIWQDWKGRGDFVADQDRAELLRRTTAYKQNPMLKPVRLGLQATEWVLGGLRLADNLVVVLEKM